MNKFVDLSSTSHVGLKDMRINSMVIMDILLDLKQLKIESLKISRVSPLQTQLIQVELDKLLKKKKQ